MSTGTDQIAFMKILHFSDLHGRHMLAAKMIIDHHRPDWIVLTGDIVPDFYMVGGRSNRLSCQQEWWSTYRNCFIGAEAVTTLTLGNHEIEGFFDRRFEAMPADLQDRVGILKGNPAEFGSWGFSWEYEPTHLQAEVDALDHPLVVLSHCPPHGLLDANRDGVNIGHRPLRYLLDKSAEKTLLVLCGHVHDSFGHVRQGRTLIVNSAAGFALLELDPASGVSQVLEMARLDLVD